MKSNGTTRQSFSPSEGADDGYPELGNLLGLKPDEQINETLATLAQAMTQLAQAQTQIIQRLDAIDAKLMR